MSLCASKANEALTETFWAFYSPPGKLPEDHTLGITEERELSINGTSGKRRQAEEVLLEHGHMRLLVGWRDLLCQ